MFFKCVSKQNGTIEIKKVNTDGLNESGEWLDC